jgi:dihydropyrimidinase
MMTAALQGRIGLPDVVRLIAGNPARIFGLAGRKGIIAPGADADLCLYDPRSEMVLQRDRMFSHARDIDRLYEGMRFQGHVAASVARGRVVYRDGAITAARGSGGFVRGDA